MSIVFRFIFSVVLALAFVFIGIYCEQNSVINHPAGWAFYGALFCFTFVLGLVYE